MNIYYHFDDTDYIVSIKEGDISNSYAHAILPKQKHHNTHAGRKLTSNTHGPWVPNHVCNSSLKYKG